MNEETPSIADIPPGWTRTSRKPFVVNGIEWRSYRRGVGLYGIVAEHRALCIVYHNIRGTTFSAVVNSQSIGRRIRSELSACEAVAKHLK